MPSSAGTGFAAGFVQALAQGMGAKQERQRKLEERQRQGFLTAYKVLAEQGYGPDELQPFLAGGIPEVFGEKAPKAKAGQPDPSKTIGDILHKSLSSSRGTPLQPGPAATQAKAPTPLASGDNLQPGGALDTGAPAAPPSSSLQSSQLAIPPAPPAQRTIDVNGQPFALKSQEQLAQRKMGIEIAGQEAAINAKVALARRILPALQAVDKSATLDDALATVGIHTPRSAGVPSFSNIPGYVVGPDGKKNPVTGILDHRTGQIVDQTTRQPIKGFLQRETAGGANDLGDLAERAAKSLGFDTATQAYSAGKGNELNALVDKLAGSTSESRATGSATGRTQVEAKAPLGSEVAANLTMRLRDQWFTAQRPVTIVKTQLANMEVGLKRFLEGDKVGGANAVLTTFQRILDPETGVREAEYDRLPGGLGLKQRLEGFVQKLSAGGAGIPDDEMKGIVQTARELAGNFENYNGALEDAIKAQIRERPELSERTIFGSQSKPAAQETGGAKTTPGATETQLPVPKDMKWVNGQLMIDR